MKTILRLTLIVLFASQLTAQTLDAGFSTGTGFNSIIYSFARQSSGKIIAGGSFTAYNGNTVNRIALLNNDGTLDNTFPATADNAVTAICVLRDQRILVGGAFALFNGQTRNKLVCLNSDGTIDASFHYSTGFAGGTSPSYYNVQAIAQQADGKILVAGEFTQYDLTSAGHIIRLNTDGTIDSSFNSTVGANSYGIYQVICQPDGKILVSGSFTSYNGTSVGNVARLNADGTLDNTFGTGANLLVRAMALQPDGKIICGGSFSSFNGTVANKLIRLDATGAIDATFNVGTGPASAINVMALHPTGKILIGGAFTTYNAIASRRLAVLNTNGTLDASFAIGAGFTGSGSISALNCNDDGKVLAGGLFSGFDGTTAGNIVRLSNTNPLPVAFTQFTAAKNGTGVMLNWTTASELNNKGFEIERSMANGSWEQAGFVAGHGNSNFSNRYQFKDDYVISSAVYYRLKQIDYNRKFTYSNTVVVSGEVAQPVTVGPNPFTDRIGLNIPSDIILYNANGQVVVVMNAVSSISTDHLPAGLYTLKITNGNQPVIQKLVKQ